MRRAEPIAGLGGLILLVSLFLTWYGVSVPDNDPEFLQSESEVVIVGVENVTGWEVFTVIDVLLAIAAALAIAVPLVSALSRGPARPVAIAVIASTVTPLAVLLVVFRMLFVPGWEGDLDFELEIRPAIGAWLSLAGALGAFVGSWLSLHDESTPGATAPDIPRRPVPNITT